MEAQRAGRPARLDTRYAAVPVSPPASPGLLQLRQSVPGCEPSRKCAVMAGRCRVTAGANSSSATRCRCQPGWWAMIRCLYAAQVVDGSSPDLERIAQPPEANEAHDPPRSSAVLKSFRRHSRPSHPLVHPPARRHQAQMEHDVRLRIGGGTRAPYHRPEVGWPGAVQNCASV